jgi:hypothetical protein
MVEGLAEDVDWMATVLPAATLATGPATNAPPLMEMPVQPALQVTVEPPWVAANTYKLLVWTVERAALVTGTKVNPNALLFVVTCQGLLVVAPTVTVAVVAVESEVDDVCSMAMVSPLLKPATGPATNAPPLRDMPVQPAPQVAVMFVKPPASVTALLMMGSFNATPVMLLKLKALTEPPPLVVAVQTALVVEPTVTVAVVAVLVLGEDI